ncbi:DUF6924 domain-containing protein [Arthrobacter humicola]
MRAVDDTAWNRVGWEQVRQAAPAGNEHASVLFVVERGALEGGYPIQITDLREASRRPFRCIARQLWGVDDNLNIANMDWGSSQEAQTARVTSGGCLTVLAASMYWEQAAAESIARSNHEILQLPPRVSRVLRCCWAINSSYAPASAWARRVGELPAWGWSDARHSGRGRRGSVR